MRIETCRSIRDVAKAMLGAAAALLIMSVPVGPSAAQDISEAVAQAAGIPQVNAFLPDKYAVAETEALPIDGVWMISTIGKRIRIERGRAYAVDSWLHFFTLKVQPDMVVLRNFQRTSAGHYAADDLPLLGPAQFRLTPDGNLSATVQGVLGPAFYVLVKREVDDDAALQAELAAMVGGGAPTPLPPPADTEPSPPADRDPLADCKNLDVDPATGDIICMD
jgi:hypothetical protein